MYFKYKAYDQNNQIHEGVIRTPNSNIKLEHLILELRNKKLLQCFDIYKISKQEYDNYLKLAKLLNNNTTPRINNQHQSESLLKSLFKKILFWK